MTFADLLRFIQKDMRMAHVYQPVMIRELLTSKGHATVEEIGRALLNEDRSQLEYYAAITNGMVGRVLRQPGVVTVKDGSYELLGFDRLTADQIKTLKTACEQRLNDYARVLGI